MSTTHDHTAHAPSGRVAGDLADLWVHRHHLPADVLRSLADIWLCATAARLPQASPDRFWEDDADFYAGHDTVSCSLRHPGHRPGSAPPVDPHAAVDAVFARRHRLSAGELYAVQRIWCCAGAAQWGEPHERFWDLDLDGLLRAHDSAMCESPTPFDEVGDLLSGADGRDGARRAAAPTTGEREAER
ncbi:hypothetical protein SAMN05216207_10524 [Pseudonocardia ammonioxydans]|uniref:Uncharacterized protein n=1 Tax=Pseudonocardia ammonioxydans TaxID=260086 RepID=A0A1I5GWX6_PSUAM|nr:hypothetical protein [Pseudonocardia ammonioxydans]SFO40326.1 hypothetical protein SAMN05216207_10524 [Pseudonocardia ammonioxydans]